jgi:hypothetical protein
MTDVIFLIMMIIMTPIGGQDRNPALKNPMFYKIQVMMLQKECLALQGFYKYLNDHFYEFWGIYFPGFHFYLI